jgi:hypothetical protein
MYQQAFSKYKEKAKGISVFLTLLICWFATPHPQPHVECPLCFKKFHSARIAAHASGYGNGQRVTASD